MENEGSSDPRVLVYKAVVDSSDPSLLVYKAVVDNNTDLLETLLQGEGKHCINQCDDKGRTPLYSAVDEGLVECCHLLLHNGADPNAKNISEIKLQSPLHVAASNNNSKLVALLLEFGASWYLKNKDGVTALEMALLAQSVDVVHIIDTYAKDRECELRKSLEDRNVNRARHLISQLPEDSVKRVLSKGSKGHHSFLFKACEDGDAGIVTFLLDNGCDIGIHPVTGQSPLHAACASGQLECARMVLKNFPELIRAPTIDGILPLHTTCIVGQLDILKLILNYDYPDPIMKIFKEQNGNRMYRLGFAINARDGHGRTPLHIACMMNQPEIVEELLKFRVKVASKYSEGAIQRLSAQSDLESIRSSVHSALSLEETMQEGLNQIEQMSRHEGHTTEKQPTAKKRDRIDSDISVEECSEVLTTENKKKEEFFNPVAAEIDSIDLDGNTPLHIVIKSDTDSDSTNFYRIAELLLYSGSNPDKPMVTHFGNIFPLTNACFNGDSKMVEILLNHGATDPDMKAFTTALKNQNEDIIGSFLRAKNHVDSSNKVNVVELVSLFKGEQLDSWQSQTVTLRYVWPNVAVSLNWHGLDLPFISSDWLKAASLQHNRKKPRAKLPVIDNLPLFAITRVDISKNRLTMLPVELCQLPSLRYINASNNEIKWLPGCDIQVARSCSCMLGMAACTHICAQQETVEQQDLLWNCPLLEEVNLQHNKLLSLPRALFRKDSCPSLRKLNASHNDIERVPAEVWNSPCLLDLNLSHNCITELGFNSISRSPSVTDAESLSLRSRSERLSSSSSVDTMRSTVTGSSDAVSSHRDSSGSELVRLSFPPSLFQSVPVVRVCHWMGKLKVRVETDKAGEENQNSTKMCQITDLNLSHNLLEQIPEGIACVVPQLDKLDLSFNRITSVSSVGSLPAGISELDLSYNQVESWFSHQVLLDLENSASLDSAYTGVLCYGQVRTTKLKRTLKTIPSSNQCTHKSHTQLDKLKVLRLNDNQIVRFNVRPQQKAGGGKDRDERGEYHTSTESSGSHGSTAPVSNTKTALDPDNTLYCPVLSILDLSNNLLTTVDKDIVLLNQLSELKLAHNEKLIELPPEMGLFKKLWNLDIKDCPVQRTYQALLGDSIRRTAVILKYLKSVKDNAVLYNHMKLMFVGIQGIGKTSLLEQLRKEGAGPGKKYKNWSQRMSQSTIQDRCLKGENISTVGVDIGDLVLQRNNRKVVFSTWDFGGQREYYATHQYFLSKRSLYLVVWKLTDGEKGVHQILQWLVNIQARAPNSPVIIVGTHLDLISKGKYGPNYITDLRKLIFDKYMMHTEPEKSGLPRVLACIEVSTKSRLLFNNHISDLVNHIVKSCVEEQLPGSKGVKLLEQKVPACYVQLESVVRELADERKKSGKDPVLHAEQYKMLVMHKMEERFSESFSDLSELHQATQFLHENGVLLHYDDVNLQDVFFLDPQWLCDVLANVVTIREINGLAKSGIMRTDDLKVLFKNAAFRPEDIKTYIINLLNKFEVALMWDAQSLLIPSMLPTEGDLKVMGPLAEVKIPVLGSSEVTPFRESLIIHTGITQRPLTIGESNFFVGVQKHEGTNVDHKQHQSSNIGDIAPNQQENSDHLDMIPQISTISNPATAIVRLYLMSYFPSGFWPRLITRLLGDSSFYATAMSVYDLPDAVMCHDKFMKTQGTCPQWLCWQTGLKLKYLGATLLKVKEIVKDASHKFCDYRQCQLITNIDRDWAPVDTESTSILEIVIPNEVLSMSLQFQSDLDEIHPVNVAVASESVVLRPSPQVVAVLLTKIVEHVDTLLEDWYPDLGSRFVQNSRGMYLITRLVPCMKCLVVQSEQQAKALATGNAWELVNTYGGDGQARVSHPVIIDPQQQTDRERRRTSEGFSASCPAPENKYDSSQFTWSQDFGSKRRTVGGRAEKSVPSLCRMSSNLASLLVPPMDSVLSSSVYCYLVEQCLYAAQLRRVVFCPTHSNLGPYFIASSDGHVTQGHIAPDSVFQDLDDHSLIDSDLISRGNFLGRGAFGAVYAGNLIHKHSGEAIHIAMKMMQPVEPGADASNTVQRAYKQEKEKWNKDPVKHACEAYLNLRKELSILLSLQHDHIVGMMGISLHPLCLVLSLAPLGSLGDQLKHYNRFGNRLAMYSVRNIVIQVASALTYLHNNQIIYRDLKSENVLVWSLPPSDNPTAIKPVDVKLADYGVSRSVLATGTKGLAGTHPFMAPEIMQHNGEESYTEKVDCFSFGMFLYEVLTLGIPFEGEVTSGWAIRGHRENCVVSGIRPSITQQELVYPTHVFDLMVMCWAHDPNERPSASQIETIARSAEFCQLYSVLPLEEAEGVRCAVCAPHQEEAEWEQDEEDLLPTVDEQPSHDVWVSSQIPGQDNVLSVYTFLGHDCVHSKRLEVDRQCEITVMCVAGNYVWCADRQAKIHVYSAKSCKEALSFNATSRPGLKVKTMVYSAEEKNVYVVMDNGSFAVCQCYVSDMSSSISDAVYNRSPSHSPEGQNLVKTECPGNGRPIHCMTVRKVYRGDLGYDSELWCGQDRGKLSIWNLGTGLQSPPTPITQSPRSSPTPSQRSMNSSPRSSPTATKRTPRSSPTPSRPNSGVVRMVNHPKSGSDKARDVIFMTASSYDETALWTYIYPGTIVYRWDISSRQVSHSTDIAQFVPKDPPPAIQKHINNGKFDATKCQVTSLCNHGNHLFLGTTLGCMLVLHGETLSPISLLHSHSDSVRTIMPLWCAPVKEVDSLSASSSASSLKVEDIPPEFPAILSIGKGYNDMISKLVPKYDIVRNNRFHYMLLWRADLWKDIGAIKFSDGSIE